MKGQHTVDDLLQRRESLLAAWLAIEPTARTHSGGRSISYVNGMVLDELTVAGRFVEAESLIQQHALFCEQSGVSVFGGRSEEAFESFVQVHAMIFAARGSDPLSGKELPYELEAVSNRYRVLREFIEYGGERAMEIGGITITSVPHDETLGKCVILDSRGRLISSLNVGFLFEQREGRLIDRLRSVYLDRGATSGGGGIIYERQPGIQYIDELIRSRSVNSGAVGLRPRRNEVPLDQSAAVVEKSRLPMISVVAACGFLGAAMWVARKRWVIR